MNNKKRLQVLIIDDQLGVRMLLSEAFKNENCKVFTSANGEEALEMIKERCPDIIFLDMKMPKKDGAFVILELRNLQYQGSIVLMTGMETIDANLDVDYILNKPFDIDEAIDILLQLLNTREKKCLS